MRHFSVLLLLLLGLQTGAYAQGEGNNWVFGHENGLNFNNNPPTFFQTSSISLEGSAAISDASGNLLFYSSGNDVYDATGTVMPNGSGILGNGTAGFAPGSSAQGVAIVKSLSNSTQYYLFTLDASEQINPFNYPGYLRYSLVDMTLNGGAGDVVTGQKNIMLDTAMTEQMTIVKGAGCYYWLLCHRNNSAAYRAFRIDATGINPGISSNGTAMGSIGSGQMKVSHDGTKVVNGNSFLTSKVEIGNFDNATGMVSGTVLFDSMPGAIRLGTCFSPDNSKLYVTTYTDIAQYDLASFPNAAGIAASKVVLSSNHSFSNLRNGPDGKIYVSIYSGVPFLSTISNPDNAGAACNFNLNALPQPAWATFTTGGSPYGHGLGNDIVVGVEGDTTAGDASDTLICQADTFHVSAPAGYNDYQWSDGSTSPSRDITAAGVYWVYSAQNCNIRIDTFKLDVTAIDVDLGPDTAICFNDQLVLNATNTGASYRWQDGSTDPTFTVTKKGIYSVKVTKDICSATDTIIVDFFQPTLDIPENDTTICDDESITLHAVTNTDSRYQWSDGSNTATTTTHKEGTYIVTATNVCGTLKDSVTIAVQNCNCKAFVPNAFSPNGDGNNEKFVIKANCNATHFTMSIYNRYGQRIYQSHSPDKGWDGTFEGKPSDIGTYFYYIRYKGPRGDDFERKGDLTLLR